jgi:hypothetical protein
MVQGVAQEPFLQTWPDGQSDSQQVADVMQALSQRL